MPKTYEEREAKRCNRMGVPVEIDLVEASDVAPTYRKTRWGWALSELTGRCFSYAAWGGGWPFTMGFRKHLWTKKGICRRCGNRAPSAHERAFDATLRKGFKQIGLVSRRTSSGE